MELSVCATAIPSANGITIGMTAGSTSAAISKKVAADCPLLVTMLMRVRTCVVHTMARTHSSVTAKIAKVRRMM